MARARRIAAEAFAVWALITVGAGSTRSQPADLDADTAGPAAAASDPAPIAGQAPIPEITAQRQQPAVIQRPRVVDTATFGDGARLVRLFGVTGLAGRQAEDLRGYIASHGDRLTCDERATGEFDCRLPDGTDLAAVALLNGAAQTRTDAPDRYNTLQNDAMAARRGVWASLPPPPVALVHPALLDTATVVAGGARYPLDGVLGVGEPYAGDMRRYIVARGDALSCHRPGSAPRFVCLLPDGSDIATAALLNGAASVAQDASDDYRRQQADAIADHRGIWREARPENFPPPADPVPEPLSPPTEFGDGVSYVDDAPVAVVEGETVLLVFGGDAGWGYYDRWRRWHGAPDRLRIHMERFHPEGRGLRGWTPPDAPRRIWPEEARLRNGGPGPGRPAEGVAPREFAHAAAADRLAPVVAARQAPPPAGARVWAGQPLLARSGSADRGGSPTGRASLQPTASLAQSAAAPSAVGPPTAPVFMPRPATIPPRAKACVGKSC